MINKFCVKGLHSDIDKIGLVGTSWFLPPFALQNVFRYWGRYFHDDLLIFIQELTLSHLSFKHSVFFLILLRITTLCYCPMISIPFSRWRPKSQSRLPSKSIQQKRVRRRVGVRTKAKINWEDTVNEYVCGLERCTIIRVKKQSWEAVIPRRTTPKYLWLNHGTK